MVFDLYRDRNSSKLHSKLVGALPTHKTLVQLPEPIEESEKDSGTYALKLTQQTDSEGWLVVDGYQLTTYLNNKLPEPFLGAGGVQELLDRNHLRDQLYTILQELWCPPGSVYRCWDEAPLIRLTQHLNPTHLEDRENILIIRAGGINSKSGRTGLAKWVPMLRQDLKEFAPVQYAKMCTFYQLMHSALRYVESEECRNPFAEAGIAWVNGFLYFHFGRALLNLPKEVIYGQTGISPNVPVGDIIEEFRTITTKPQKSALDRVFLNTLVPADTTSAIQMALWKAVTTTLRPMDVKNFIDPTDYYINFKASDDFAVLIDICGKDSLQTFYRAAAVKLAQSNAILTVAPREEIQKEDYVAKTRLHDKKSTVFNVAVNACELGFEFKIVGDTLAEEAAYEREMQGRVCPLSMMIHKSQRGDYYLSTPDELQSIFDPIVSAYTTGRLMRTGAGESIKMPLSATGKPLTQRRLFFYKRDTSEERLLFNSALLAADGDIIADAERIIRANKHIQSNKHLLRVFAAYKNFLMWLVWPESLLKEGVLTGELFDVVQNSPADSPIYLKNLDERLAYLHSRARGMDSPSRWLHGMYSFNVDTNYSTTRIRSPNMTDYDKYALHKGLAELRIRKTSYLNKAQRCEYLVRRWLPWHTPSFIYRFVEDLPEDKYFHRLKRLPRRNDEAMQNFIRESAKKFGTPVVTGVI